MHQPKEEMTMMKIGLNKPTYVIAEAGINHNGDIKIAKKMIDSAADSGANAIKFQTIIPEELFSSTLNPELFQMAKNWILNENDHVTLQQHANKKGIDFFSTPFGVKSAKLLQKIKVPFVKIASGEVTNHDLISYIAKMKTPILLSTGMSNLSEIAEAVEIIKNNNCKFVLLHCISSYPTKPSDANLSTIQKLYQIFNVPVGFSDHTVGIDVSLTAVALGARVIEKHFTLDKNMEGPDQKLSIDPNELSELVRKIRQIEESIGTPRTNPIGVELTFKKNMRKSIGANCNIPSGTMIKRSMLSVFRPGTGISPTMMDIVIGRKAKKSIKKGTLLSWDDL